MGLKGGMDIRELAEVIIGCTFRVHGELGAGFVEKVYENSLCIELREAGVEVKQQEAVQVRYRGHLVGDFQADVLVEGRMIVELKAVRRLGAEHEVQLVNYLNATGIDDGLLINFGESVEVKRKFRKYRAKKDNRKEF